MIRVNEVCRAFIAVCVGVILDATVWFGMSTFNLFHEVWSSHIHLWVYEMALPVLIGGFAAGFFARYYGWVLGVLTTTVFVVWFHVDYLDFWHNTWLGIALGLTVGAFGGFLGANVAQIWHKQQKGSLRKVLKILLRL